MIQGRAVRRAAIPAEDMMQAFIYRHLVPAQDLMVTAAGQWRSRTVVKLAEQGPARIPAGGSAEVQFTVAGIALVKGIEFALSDPPEGIEIKETSPLSSGVTLVLRADAEKAEPGLKGNLIVDVSIERSFSRGPGKPKAPKRRVPVGVLPAIPFEVVAP